MTLHPGADGERAEHKPRWTRTVYHGGRHYVATTEMASIFETKAMDVVGRGETELVPLLHRGGVDLLLVTPTTTIAIVNIEVGLTAATQPIPRIDHAAS